MTRGRAKAAAEIPQVNGPFGLFIESRVISDGCLLRFWRTRGLVLAEAFGPRRRAQAAGGTTWRAGVALRLYFRPRADRTRESRRSWAVAWLYLSGTAGGRRRVDKAATCAGLHAEALCARTAPARYADRKGSREEN